MAGTGDPARTGGGRPPCSSKRPPSSWPCAPSCAAYYAELLTDEVRGRASARRARAASSGARSSRQIGKDGWLGHRLAQGVRRPGPAGHRPVHLLRRDPAGRRPVPLRHRQHRRARPSCASAPTSRSRSSCPASWPARSTSPSATPSPRPAPTWPRCGPGPCATATSTWSTATRSSPAAPTRPTTSGWPCRTDPDAPKHKGISILCVPTDSPGFSWTPIVTVAGARTTATYYDDVRVPVAALVGDENEGWRMITTQLNHERVGLAAWSGLRLAALRGGRGVGGEHDRPRRPDGARPGLGADGPGPVPGRARGHVPPQLAHGRGRGRRAPEPGRLLDGQDLRDRAQHRDLPAAARDRGRGGLPVARLARGGPGRSARAHRPPRPDQHLRRRGQRDPTRDRGHGRPGHDPGVRDERPPRRPRRRRLLARLQRLRGQASGPPMRGPRRRSTRP